MPTSYRTAFEIQAMRQAVLTRAAAQGGVFRREDLNAWGFDATVLPVMVRRGHWRKLRYGVYADATVLDHGHNDPRQKHLTSCAAAISALRLPAYVFGTSAALVHGLPLDRHIEPRPHLVRHAYRDVRALNRSPNRPPGLADVHVATHDLSAEDLTVLDGVPIVGRPLAAVSASCQSSPDWAVGLLDAVLWDGSATLEELQAMIDRWPLLKGIGTARRACLLARPGAQTILESLSRVRLVRAGLDEPRLQVPFHDAAGLIGYADMFWEHLGVIGEADGRSKYATREDVFLEKVREDRLRELGYEVVRWTWIEIMTDPAAVVRRIIAASRRSRRRVA